MRQFTAVIERDAATGLYVGFVPGWPGAHSQAETVDELNDNFPIQALRELPADLVIPPRLVVSRDVGEAVL